MYKIYGRYDGGDAEEIGETVTREEAEYLLSEYSLAYGAGWELWIRGEK